MIIDSAEYRDQLPTSIAAVFFTQEPDCATRTHRMIVDTYGIDPGQVLLLEHTPGASPGFKVHTPAKGEGEPDAADVPAAVLRVGDEEYFPEGDNEHRPEKGVMSNSGTESPQGLDVSDNDAEQPPTLTDSML